MSKFFYLVLVIFVLLFSVLPVQARGHGHFSFHGGVWLGPGWGGWGPWWWGPAYPYYSYPYYYGYPYYYDYDWAPPVTQERRQEYVEPAPQDENYYWYFCPDARNYYPYVKQCPKGWLKVVPPPAPQDSGE